MPRFNRFFDNKCVVPQIHTFQSRRHHTIIGFRSNNMNFFNWFFLKKRVNIYSLSFKSTSCQFFYYKSIFFSEKRWEFWSQRIIFTHINPTNLSIPKTLYIVKLKSKNNHIIRDIFKNFHNLRDDILIPFKNKCRLHIDHKKSFFFSSIWDFHITNR